MPDSRTSSPRQVLGRLLLTAFGLGTVPGLPGTAASLVVAGFVGLVASEPVSTAAFCALLVIFGCAVTLRFAGDVTDDDGHGDPSWVVSDEVAGQALACAGALPCGCSWPALLAAFVLFRVLDIAKPWPVGALERLPGGVGVLMDDVAAGVIAGVAVALACALGWLPVA